MRFRYLAGLSFAVALAASAAPAQELGTHVGGAPVGFNNGNWSLGYFFDVTSPFTVSYLAFWDEGNDGFTQSHDVGIFDATGTTLISSASLAAGSGAPLLEGFRLVAVTPFTLGIGSYQVMGTTGDELYTCEGIVGVTGCYGAVLTNAFGISYVADAYCASSTLVSNCSGPDPYNGYFGANFAGTAVPEPASMALLGTGLVGLYGAIRRRREQRE